MKLRFLFFILFLILVQGSANAGQLEDDTVESGTLKILKMINVARANPFGEAERLGIDTEELRTTVGDMAWSRWMDGLEPLSWNENLSEFAAVQLDVLLKDIKLAENIQDELSDHLKYYGYDAAVAGMAVGAIAFADVLAEDAAAEFAVTSVLRDAFFQGLDKVSVLDFRVKDMGCAVGGTQVEYGGINYNVFFVVIVVGASLDNKTNMNQWRYVFGHVYTDFNYNGTYDAGEEMANVELVLSGPLYEDDALVSPAYYIMTDDAGRYQVPLYSNAAYYIYIVSEDDSLNNGRLIYTDSLFDGVFDIAIW